MSTFSFSSVIRVYKRMKGMKHTQMKLLIGRLLGSLNPKEMKQFQDWFDESPDNETVFRDESRR